MTEHLSDTQLISALKQRLLERQAKLKEIEITHKELMRLNEALILSESNKSKFLSLIRNEFNNPLFAIIPIVLELKHSETDSTKIELIDMVYEQMLQLNFQLSNVISAAEIETAILEREFSTFALPTLVDSALEVLAFMHRDKAIEPKSTIDVTEVIFNDREKLYSIVLNLLSNAFEFSKDGSFIELIAKIDADRLIISISNEGNEIADTKKVFQGFYQERISQYNRTTHGLGIGLTIVKDFTEFLGGDVEVSRDEGRNIFTVRLPYSQEQKENIFGGAYDECTYNFDDFTTSDETKF